MKKVICNLKEVLEVGFDKNYSDFIGLECIKKENETTVCQNTFWDERRKCEASINGNNISPIRWRTSNGRSKTLPSMLGCVKLLKNQLRPDLNFSISTLKSLNCYYFKSIEEDFKSS